MSPSCAWLYCGIMGQHVGRMPHYIFPQESSQKIKYMYWIIDQYTRTWTCVSCVFAKLQEIRFSIAKNTSYSYSKLYTVPITIDIPKSVHVSQCSHSPHALCIGCMSLYCGTRAQMVQNRGYVTCDWDCTCIQSRSLCFEAVQPIVQVEL